ncbi:hypothetical protein N7478_010748, partial [Penicillium angulare]|uniref:uncharacterized protein n=1 Tax=Penicillium angulare TaxID=116970 RepID=UPI00253FEFD8
PFDTPAVSQCVRNTWRVTLKPKESPDPLKGYVDGFKVAIHTPSDTALPERMAIHQASLSPC